MLRNLPAIALMGVVLACPAASVARPMQIVDDSGGVMPAYADVAGLTLMAPLVISGSIRSASKITGADAAGVPAGVQRYYVTLDVQSLLRGDSAVPAQIGYVLDIPLIAGQRPPKLRKQRVILFARPVANRPELVQLVDTDAQRNWSAELEQLTRQIVADVLKPSAPPAITGVGNAFYVPGTLPGEGQSQIFLTTDAGQPVSLIVEHQPGAAPRWSVSFSDLVDQAAPPPPRDSFAWFRLACGLPGSLPDTSIAADDSTAAAILRNDYARIVRDLGPCTGKRG